MAKKTPPPVIQLVDLHKTFGFGDASTTAIDGLNLTIEKGEFVAIMGPSGCGKTTLLNILGLLDTASHGEYYLNEKDVSTISQSKRAKLRRDSIGFIFQSFNLLNRMNVIENVALPLTYTGMARTARLRAASKALKLFHLQNREYYTPAQLSGGQSQRVAIARALVNDPALILADEPTGNLDSKSSEIIMQELSEIHGRGNTIIMVTHNARLTSYADRIIHMLDGNISYDSKASVVAEENIDSAAKIPLGLKRETKKKKADTQKKPLDKNSRPKTGAKKK